VTEDEGGQLPDAACAEAERRDHDETTLIPPLMNYAKAYVSGRLDAAAMEALARNVSPAIIETWTSLFDVGPNREFGLRLQEIINSKQVNVTGARLVNVHETVATATRDGIGGLTPSSCSSWCWSGCWRSARR
jgi:hypothetical protein